MRTLSEASGNARASGHNAHLLQRCAPGIYRFLGTTGVVMACRDMSCPVTQAASKPALELAGEAPGSHGRDVRR